MPMYMDIHEVQGATAGVLRGFDRPIRVHAVEWPAQA